MSEIILFFSGVLIGCVIPLYLLLRKSKSNGVLMIDNSDPDEDPYLFVELELGFTSLSKKERILLDVNADRYTPHN
ncbi:MAG: hypothetical protein RR475_02540 [Clostridia bacterium]